MPDARPPFQVSLRHLFLATPPLCVALALVFQASKMEATVFCGGAAIVAMLLEWRRWSPRDGAVGARLRFARRVKRAVLIGSVILVHSFLIRAAELRAVTTPPDRTIVFAVAWLAFLAYVCLPVLWSILAGGVAFIVRIAYWNLGRGPWRRWRNAVLDSFWTLPYAAGLGVLLVLPYVTFKLGGWPGDVIVTFVADALGAWDCGTALWTGWRLRSGSVDSRHGRRG
jgi:hypothetical protein